MLNGCPSIRPFHVCAVELSFSVIIKTEKKVNKRKREKEKERKKRKKKRVINETSRGPAGVPCLLGGNSRDVEMGAERRVTED